MMSIALAEVQSALALNPFDATAAHQLMAPLARNLDRPPAMTGAARVSSVLLLLYCYRSELHLVLTRRRDDSNSHAGQISFPGGRLEPAESAEAAALRETHEEVGVPPARVSILGRLASIWIPPSDFKVYPFVGWYASGERPSFTPEVGEVAEILETPVTHLLRPATRQIGIVQGRDYEVTAPYFDVEGQKVWGATAVMLSEFVERLRQVVSLAE